MLRVINNIGYEEGEHVSVPFQNFKTVQCTRTSREE